MKLNSALEVSEVFLRFKKRNPEYKFSRDREKVFEAVVSCRTAKLGGHIYRCNECDHLEQSYNSCWNRHCPKCQGGDSFKWTSKRGEELLPIPYFHVVFTMPQEFKELCYRNKKIFYEILFKSSSETLQEISRNNLKLKPGFFGVLHTWNQELEYHPHLHYVVTGGGVNEKGTWSNFPQKGKFFLPVRVLSRVYRGKFISLLKETYHKKKLYLKNSLEYLEDPREFERLISRSAAKEWIVYAKRSFASPKIVLKYLANYTHRIGISNHRLRSIDEKTVTFSARHKTHKGKKRVVTISHKAFVSRFMLHIIPRKFRRIRYFGFLASRTKKTNLAKIRSELNASPIEKEELPLKTCPACKKGTLQRADPFKPHSYPSKPLLSHILKPKTTFSCLSPPL